MNRSTRPYIPAVCAFMFLAFSLGRLSQISLENEQRQTTIVDCPVRQQRAVDDAKSGRWLVYAGEEEDQCHLNDLVHQYRVWIKHLAPHRHSTQYR